MNEKLKNRLDKSTGLFIAMCGFLVGSILVSWAGHTKENEFISIVGGAFFGATLGAIFGRFSYADIKDEIKQRLNGFFNAKFVSDPKQIKWLKGPWHVYHITRMKQHFYWRHTIFDFIATDFSNQLLTKVSIKDFNGKTISYFAEAGMRGDKFIIFAKHEDLNEPITVFIFPSMGSFAITKYYGFAILQTFDNSPSLSPSIISKDAIFGEEDTISYETSKQLDLEWKNHMKQKGYDLLPIAS